MELADPRTLLGTWRFHRVIEDRHAAESGHFDGTLTLSDDGDRLRWQEEAVWHRPEAEVDVRRLLWLVEQQGEWLVLFEDERPFHPWRPGAEVVHDCTPDTYRGTVTARGHGWRVVWQVSGPSKDYTMTTELTR